MDDDELNYGCHPALMLFNCADFYSYCDVYSSHPASRHAKKEKVRRCVDELRSVLSNTGVEVTGNTTLATLKATIDTLTKTLQEGEHREMREDGFRLSSVHQSLPFLDEKTYMLRISLDEGEILSVDRSLLELLNYPEHSWRTCQLANFLCMADIPCLLSCLMRIHKTSHRGDAACPNIDGTRQHVQEEEEEEEEEDEEEKVEGEESGMQETFQEHCMFRLRVGPSVSKGAYGLGSRRKLMVPFVAEITLKKAKMTGQSVSGGTNSSAGTRIALIANSETTSAVGSSMRSSSGTAQTHKSRDHVRMTLHKMNHAYPRHRDNDSDVMDEESDPRDEKRKPITFTSRIRRCSGVFVSNSVEKDGILRTQELLKEVAMVAILGYLPQDIYGGISIFDVVHPADLINLYEPLKKVISSRNTNGRKLWISSPPVRWRCLNSSHTLIETRFCLSENTQTIHCRHMVVLEPECLDNFFDRVDVEHGPMGTKEEDGAEHVKLGRLQREWGARLRSLIAGTSEGAGELEPDPPWSKASPSLISQPGKEIAGCTSAENLSCATHHAVCCSGMAPGTAGESKKSMEGHEGEEHQQDLRERQRKLTDASTRPQRMSLKGSRHHRRRMGQLEEKSHKTHESSRRNKRSWRESDMDDEEDKTESKKGEDEREMEEKTQETGDLNELCYDSWSQLERVQGYLASVAGVESASAPPSRLVPSGDNSLAAMLTHSVRDSSLTVSNVANVDFQDQYMDGEADGEHHMETDAMAVAMAAAVTAGVRMSPTWSADVGTTSTASLTVENLARHTREQEMAYKRHLWRHLQREHERAAADRIEPKIATSRHIKRPHPVDSRPHRDNWEEDEDVDDRDKHSVLVSSASLNEATQVKRPLLSNAPPPIYPYMWMIPVVPPVPPYLLYPPGHENPNPGTAPAPPPLLATSHYPPGWDVGVLSHEMNSSECDDSGMERQWVQMENRQFPVSNAEEEDEEDEDETTRGWRNHCRLFPYITSPLYGRQSQQRRSHRCRCQGDRRRKRGRGPSRTERQKKPLNPSRRRLEHSSSGYPGRKRSSSSRLERQSGSQGSPQRLTNEEWYGAISRTKRKAAEEVTDSDDLQADALGDAIAERLDNPMSQMGNATVKSIAGSSTLYLYDGSSQSSTQQPVRRRPPPFWTRSNNIRPVLSTEDSMRYQIPVPSDTRGINLLYKCQVNRLTQSEMVVHQLFEMLNIDNETQQNSPEEVEGDEDFDDLNDDGDESLVEVDRIISQLLFEGDRSSDASSSDIVTSDDSVTSWNFREPRLPNDGLSGPAIDDNCPSRVSRRQVKQSDGVDLDNEEPNPDPREDEGETNEPCEEQVPSEVEKMDVSKEGVALPNEELNDGLPKEDSMEVTKGDDKEKEND